MKKAIKALLLLLWMSLVFFLSAQVANESSETTNIVIEIIYKLYKTLFANSNMDIVAFSNVVFIPVRKLAHFSEFAILGILFYINIKEYTNNKVLLLSVLLSSLYAVSDEIHQLFVPGRACAFIDMLIDSSGAFIGIVLIHLVTNRCLRKD